MLTRDKLSYSHFRILRSMCMIIIGWKFIFTASVNAHIFLRLFVDSEFLSPTVYDFLRFKSFTPFFLIYTCFLASRVWFSDTSVIYPGNSLEFLNTQLDSLEDLFLNSQLFVLSSFSGLTKVDAWLFEYILPLWVLSVSKSILCDGSNETFDGSNARDICGNIFWRSPLLLFDLFSSFLFY